MSRFSGYFRLVSVSKYARGTNIQQLLGVGGIWWGQSPTLSNRMIHNKQTVRYNYYLVRDFCSEASKPKRRLHPSPCGSFHFRRYWFDPTLIQRTMSGSETEMNNNSVTSVSSCARMVIIFPMISISTLSTIIYASSARKEIDRICTTKGYQIALLLCMQFAHGIVITSDRDERIRSNDEFSPYEYGGELSELMIISYVPILFSIVDAFTLSLRPWNMVCQTKHHPIPAQIFTLKTFLRSSIPSSLILLYTTLFMKVIYADDADKKQNEKIFWQFTSFMTSWIFCTLLSVSKKRNLMVSHANANTFGQIYNHLTPDERGWERWSTRKFLQWVTYNHLEKKKHFQIGKSDNDNDNDGDELQCLLDLLEGERINGESIPFIQLDDLRSMGVSFGQGIVLLKQIQDLLRKYPSKSQQMPFPQSQTSGMQQNQNSGEDEIDLDAWLGKSKSETAARTEARAEDAKKAETNYLISSAGENESKMKAEDFMNDRFGTSIQISGVQSDDFSEQSCFTSVGTNPTGIEEQSSSHLPKSSVTSNESSIFGIDEAFLSTLPPNVREIAERRPDLVNSLMSNAEPAVNHAQSLSSNEPLQVIDEEIGYWQEGQGPKNQEMVGLLRRRKNT